MKTDVNDILSIVQHYYDKEFNEYVLIKNDCNASKALKQRHEGRLEVIAELYIYLKEKISNEN